VRREKWAERVIDIDILYYGRHIITTENLSVPHPEIQNRRFTLVPMCELAPGFVHPVLKRDQETLLMQCSDPLNVERAFDTSWVDPTPQ
jgi:2-amino-4-hydroxy-6-hydroxymethyldihydropteridine diphosphokinase